MRNLSRHANAFPQSRVRVNRLADVHSIRPHFNGQRDFANHSARMRAEHAAIQHPVVTQASMAAF